MNPQPLGPRWRHRIEHVTGYTVPAAQGDGGLRFEFVTSGHLHGWFDLDQYRQRVRLDRTLGLGRTNWAPINDRDRAPTDRGRGSVWDLHGFPDGSGLTLNAHWPACDELFPDWAGYRIRQTSMRNLAAKVAAGRGPVAQGNIPVPGLTLHPDLTDEESTQ